MQVLAPHFLVIAPDTPGYGQSDPVAAAGSEPTIDVFADAVIGPSMRSRPRSHRAVRLAHRRHHRGAGREPPAPQASRRWSRTASS
ncbi:MAG: hypothetical protein U1F11_05305 [Steroidobacteraceae bacterium]